MNILIQLVRFPIQHVNHRTVEECEVVPPLVIQRVNINKPLARIDAPNALPTITEEHRV